MPLPPGIMGIQDWLFYTLLGGTVLAVLLLFFVLIIFMLTPAGAFLKAKFKNLPIFLMSGRDGVGGFFVPQFSENQYAHFKKQGTYGITRESHIFDRKSKQPIYIADKDVGASYKRDWPAVVEQLKQHFPKLKGGKDYIALVEDALKDPENLKKNPELLIKGATMKVTDLAKYFPLNLKPTYIDEYAMIAVRRAQRREKTLQFLLVLAVLMMCVGIAGYLLMSQANKAKFTCECDVGEAINAMCGLPGQIGGPGGIQRINGTTGIIQEKPKSNPGAVLS